MGTRKQLIALLAFSVALFVLSRTKQGAQVVADVTDSIASGVIGYRLNNPLNIERGTDWDGLAPEQTNSRFAEFISMPYGVRAAAITLRNYQHLHGLNTVASIVNRWNPVSDGQPPSYIPNVADDMGVPSDFPLNLDNRAIMFSLIRAMMKQEIGSVTALLISDAQVNAGLDLAGYA